MGCHSMHDRSPYVIPVKHEVSATSERSCLTDQYNTKMLKDLVLLWIPVMHALPQSLSLVMYVSLVSLTPVKHISPKSLTQERHYYKC